MHSKVAHRAKMRISYSFSISCVRSVAGFFFSRANLGPLVSLYVLQDSGVICCLFFNASASALLTSCSGSYAFIPAFLRGTHRLAMQQ